MPEPDMTPATRHDLQELRTEICAELRAELASKADLQALESRLMAAFAQLAASLREYLGDLVRPFDDKYRHLPGEIAAVKQELAAHASDKSIHQTHARTKRARPKRRP